MTLGCNDLGVYPLEIWATDALGNQNYLETFVVLLDPDGLCNEPITIAFSPNDMVCDADAVDLTPYIGAGPICFNNIDATVQAGEAVPPNGDCFAQNAWCDGGIAHTSVWFIVLAPPSGNLKIETDGVYDMQLAVWQAPDCNDLLAGAPQLKGANDNRPGDPHGNASLEVSLAPGEKYFIQADGHGISETGLFYLTLTELTGVHDRRPELEFTVFPNPASGSFSIRLPGPMNQDGLLTLYNALGSRVAAQTLPAGTTEREINIGELPAGVYTCRIAIGLELAGTKKIVVF
ncbi:MAG: T9SS type A sorting domain-containing protein [Saprospirales bacterium]|nr:T9SS type A sorting domain-containing protein [Saprospirales bacterium]